MIDHTRWRDQQLSGFAGSTVNNILAQEQVMLNFVSSHKNVCWKWMGNDTKFKDICRQTVCLDQHNAQGVIVFGKRLRQMTTKKLVTTIKEIVQHYDYAYVAVNRYEVIAHDLDFELPDSIADSLDSVMQYCNEKFSRLHTFDQVDGNHMVAAHPMDCYGLCKL